MRRPEIDVEGLQNAFREMAEMATNLWSDVERFLHDLAVTRDEIGYGKMLRNQWYVPKNIIINHQVIDRKPMFSHIRNSI